MPQPGANGYAVIPSRQGFTTQVLPMPGGGWLIVSPGPEGRSTTVLPLPGDGSAATAPWGAMADVAMARARMMGISRCMFGRIAGTAGAAEPAATV
jgi:hypothetical protein